MADDKKPSDDDKNGKRGGDFKIHSRTLAVWIALFGVLALLVMVKEKSSSAPEKLNVKELISKVDLNLIVAGSGRISLNPQSASLRRISGRYLVNDDAGKPVIDPVTKRPRRSSSAPRLSSRTK